MTSYRKLNQKGARVRQYQNRNNRFLSEASEKARYGKQEIFDTSKLQVGDKIVQVDGKSKILRDGKYIDL
jgi:hypothetical protein